MASRTGERSAGLGPTVGRLVAGYFAFVLVEMAIWLAVVLWAFDRGGPTLAAVVSIVQLVPAAVVAPAFTAAGDRMDRGRALLLAHTVMATTTGLAGAVLQAEAPTWAVVLACTAATTAASVVRPLHFAALPSFAGRPERLVAGNAASSAVEGASRFAGPVLAGVGVTTVGAGWTLLTAGGVAALAAVACVRLPPAPATADGPGESSWREATEGLRVLRRDPAALGLLLVLATEFVLAGALDILGTAYADEELGLGETGAGLLIGSLGLGGLLGAVAGARLARRSRLAWTVLGAAAVQGVGMLLVPVGTVLVTAVAAVLVAGGGSAAMAVAGRTLLQRTTDDRVLARVFAVQESTALVALSVGAAVAPPLVALLGARWAFLPLGVLAVVVALAAGRAVRTLEGRARVPVEELALLRAVPFLRPLPPFELERLAGRAGWRDVPAGEVLLRQGDAADAWFVVAAGTLRVTVDGTARPDVLGPGASFGEVALLRAGRRPATVTAAEASRVLVVRAEDFLAAVTGSPDGRRLADDVAAAHLARDRAAS